MVAVKKRYVNKYDLTNKLLEEEINKSWKNRDKELIATLREERNNLGHDIGKIERAMNNCSNKIRKLKKERPDGKRLNKKVRK